MNRKPDFFKDGLVKVIIRTGDKVETLWAEPLGRGLFRLDNSPFFAYGVSWLDVVRAKPTPDAPGFYDYVKVVRSSGHRMIRLTVRDGQKRVSLALLKKLTSMGCTYEGMSPAYITVDIPPRVKFDPVIAMLSKTNAVWEHANPTYEQLNKARRKRVL